MSHNEKSPHQSPVHDTRESQPGLDSLAPSERFTSPHARTDAAGRATNGPRQLKSARDRE